MNLLMNFIDRYGLFLLFAGLIVLFTCLGIAFGKVWGATFDHLRLQDMANYCGRTGGTWVERTPTEWRCYTKPGGDVVWVAAR